MKERKFKVAWFAREKRFGNYVFLGYNNEPIEIEPFWLRDNFEEPFCVLIPRYASWKWGLKLLEKLEDKRR